MALELLARERERNTLHAHSLAYQPHNEPAHSDAAWDDSPCSGTADSRYCRCTCAARRAKNLLASPHTWMRATLLQCRAALPKSRHEQQTDVVAAVMADLLHPAFQARSAALLPTLLHSGSCSEGTAKPSVCIEQHANCRLGCRQWARRSCVHT